MFWGNWDVGNRILLVDGSNLLFQMFFGMPGRIVNEDGVGIWGVIGFVGALLKMICWAVPSHIAVLFDGEHENKRAAIDGAYKANRADYGEAAEEENPFSQLRYIKEALGYLGIAQAETMDCEADDWIAGYARRHGGENEVVIASFDSDFFQLIGENVTVLRYRGKKSYRCGEAYLRERYGIAPGQYAGFKALVGDASDNIKGVWGIGPKTACALLKEFGTLEGILQNAEKIKRAAVRKSVLENSERLEKNYRLIHLLGREKLPFALEEMRYSDSGKTTMQVLQGIGLIQRT